MPVAPRMPTLRRSIILQGYRAARRIAILDSRGEGEGTGLVQPVTLLARICLVLGQKLAHRAVRPFYRSSGSWDGEAVGAADVRVGLADMRIDVEGVIRGIVEGERRLRGHAGQLKGQIALGR